MKKSKPVIGLWVIEVLMDGLNESGVYEATVDCGITRKDAREKKRDIEYYEGNACNKNKYRIRKYVTK